MADLLSIPVSLLPAWLSWRYAHSRPRIVALVCPECGWSGVGKLTEAKLLDLAIPEAGEVVVRAIPNPDDVARERLERLTERRRKQARQLEAEAEPNPEFDLGNGPAPPEV